MSLGLDGIEALAQSRRMDLRDFHFRTDRGNFHAGLGDRFIASAFDGFIIQVVHEGWKLISQLPQWPEGSPWPGVLFLLYFAAFEASPLQATPGKRLMGIYVAGRDGHRLPLWRSILRNILKCLFILPPLFLGFILIWFTPRRQALHDLLLRAVHLTGTRPAREYPSGSGYQWAYKGHVKGDLQPTPSGGTPRDDS